MAVMNFQGQLTSKLESSLRVVDDRFPFLLASAHISPDSGVHPGISLICFYSRATIDKCIHTQAPLHIAIAQTPGRHGMVPGVSFCRIFLSIQFVNHDHISLVSCVEACRYRQCRWLTTADGAIYAIGAVLAHSHILSAIA